MADKNPRHDPGTRVRLIDSEDGTVEYGIVSWTWWDEQMRCWDCYISFFGTEKPEENKPQTKPYVLRYFAASLTLGWD